jgi:hypothetical protein
MLLKSKTKFLKLAAFGDGTCPAQYGGLMVKMALLSQNFPPQMIEQINPVIKNHLNLPGLIF